MSEDAQFLLTVVVMLYTIGLILWALWSYSEFRDAYNDHEKRYAAWLVLATPVWPLVGLGLLSVMLWRYLAEVIKATAR